MISKENIETEILNSSICLALFENKVDLNLINNEIYKLGDILDKLDPVLSLNVTNSIYYHYTNFKNQLKSLLKRDIESIDIQKLEQKMYIKCVSNLQKKIMH
ncbi:hypothetical protein [Spiroplasma tabanidicola]|uniref:Uncharacterized protein n=1 Tax=Spiroplasma tabanidicola TaxID=324079 RepID=A0A6I6CDG4_9MOLU|nr:hypothetical protein [Spiroplasma tabanidicola]QGS52162.1 hypothetical protein STABA_v1c08060 [Spiroplasma tabanidicola]